MSCQEKNSKLCKYCRATDVLSTSPATSTPRPYPSYSKLPDFHYLPGTRTPTSGCKPDDYQPRTDVSSSKQGIKRQSEFSEKYVVSEKLVADYIEHLTDIEMRKDKWRAENYRKLAERKQQEYNGIDWEDLYHRNQLSSLRVGELELYVNLHNTACKGKKDDKVRVVKAHIDRTARTAFRNDT